MWTDLNNSFRDELRKKTLLQVHSYIIIIIIIIIIINLILKHMTISKSIQIKAGTTRQVA